MNYISTRGDGTPFSASDVIRLGIAPDGGLFVPDVIPQLTLDDFAAMREMSYQERAVTIMGLYLSDFGEVELREMIEQAYDEARFGEHPAPLVQLNKYNDQEYILELWHGPTAAFKDIALQLLPYLMTAAARKTGQTDEICVLTATSGDTGKAALEGFRDVPGTSVMVFYPADGVSPAQKLQMVTQEGENCRVVAVEGSFDDTQTGVKSIFADPALAAELGSAGKILSSANSINWGRLLPQIVYYCSAYVDLLQRERIEPGATVNFVVPTGNFGNILAAWYASRMGLPVHRLICASNRNKILSDFIRTGRYDSRREFHVTNSPSMDILISSNLERLLFELCGRNSETVREWMNDLREQGAYEIDQESLKKLQMLFVGGYCDEKGTLRMIRDVYDRTDHLIDTHTAVGFNVYSRYANRSNDRTPTVFVSTASPLKFAGAVSDAVFGNGYSRGRGEMVLIEELAVEGGFEIPETLRDLAQRPVLHERQIRPDQMQSAVREYLLPEEPELN